MTHRFTLDFKSGKKGELRSTPTASIYLETYTQEEKGEVLSMPFITPELTTVEFNGYVDKLILELQNIKKKARRRFKNFLGNERSNK